MKNMRLHIKNMVCPRCIDTVRNSLISLNIGYNSVALGVIELASPIEAADLQALAAQLEDAGFSVLQDADSKLVTAIKTYIIEKVHFAKFITTKKLSEELSQHLAKEYSIISKTFSKVEGVTIEKYLINQKIERVKELLSYEEMNLSEIAIKLGYSSTAHLSNQFKKVTGMSPSVFKKLSEKPRRSIADI